MQVDRNQLDTDKPIIFAEWTFPFNDYRVKRRDFRLDVLLKENLTDLVVVVTRYFGGVLLGAGGLVRAYSHGAKIAVVASKMITMTLCSVVKVKSDYTFYGKLNSLIPENDGIIENTEFTDCVEVTFIMATDKVDAFNKKLIDVSNGRFFCEVIDERFCETE